MWDVDVLCNTTKKRDRMVQYTNETNKKIFNFFFLKKKQSELFNF
jgi:hypothetical protein